MTILNKQAMRKALLTPIGPALVAAGIVIPSKPTVAALSIPNLVLDRVSLQLEEYVRFSVHYGQQRVIEMGTHPRREVSGVAWGSVYTKGGTSEDRNDTIAGIVEAAYPYNAELIHDGVTVIVYDTEARDGAEDGGWWVAPVVINWKAWRYV